MIQGLVKSPVSPQNGLMNGQQQHLTFRLRAIFGPGKMTGSGLVAGYWSLVLLLFSSAASAGEITVFAAASMKNAMDEISAGFAEETGHSILLSHAGSSALARQIQFGAPADVFISANPDWMDLLQEQGLIDRASRIELLSNSLVLIAHGGNVEPVQITPGLDLATMLGEGRLAMALVEAVPAGIYGKAALETLGIWQAVMPKVAQTDNARTALMLVSVGEAAMGIVYRTDAIASDKVTVLGTFPTDTHPPIIYAAAAVSASNNPLNLRFLDYLRGPAARDAFERQGFVVMVE